MIKEEVQPAIDAGGTMKHAGVDMSKPDAIRKAVSYVGSLIDKLEHSYQYKNKPSLYEGLFHITSQTVCDIHISCKVLQPQLFSKIHRQCLLLFHLR